MLKEDVRRLFILKTSQITRVFRWRPSWQSVTSVPSSILQTFLFTPSINNSADNFQPNDIRNYQVLSKIYKQQRSLFFVVVFLSKKLIWKWILKKADRLKAFLRILRRLNPQWEGGICSECWMLYSVYTVVSGYQLT